jgi:hypothetical protein
MLLLEEIGMWDLLFDFFEPLLLAACFRPHAPSCLWLAA